MPDYTLASGMRSQMSSSFNYRQATSSATTRDIQGFRVEFTKTFSKIIPLLER